MSEVFQEILPGMMFLWVLFIGQMPMQEVLNEKDIRTLPRILSAPVTVSQFVLSKVFRAFLLCALIQAALLGISAAGFGINWGNPFYLGIVIIANALAITGMLALIYALARTKEQANALSTIFLLVSSMLGGSMFPFEQLPRTLQAIGQFSPNHWGIIAIHDVVRNRPLSQLSQPLVMLIALGLVGIIFANAFFVRSFRAVK